MKFNSDGDVVASGSHDKNIFLWRTYGDCENFMVIKGENSCLRLWKSGSELSRVP